MPPAALPARPPEPAEAPAGAATDTESEVCDPGRPFVFTHPDVADALRLQTCEQGPDGPRRLRAPALTNTLVALVQRHLRDLGYDPGPVDGLIGPRTREAVRRFQRDAGEEADGLIGFALLERIRFAAVREDRPGAASP
jgi:hypothetical protein